ncbi:MAG: LysR family transcriptional regulator [Proteobacteria bacterium]|nr:LysR family transcriptional regulator [Pseudomonadota bacterium]
MQAFVRVVEAGGFTPVAEALDTTQSTVSKRVGALETHLGVKLLHRSTRQVSLTAEGRQYFTECREILDRIEAAESQIGKAREPRGLLRASCPTGLSHHEIFPRLKRFLDRYRALRVSLYVTDRFVDLVEEGMDVGIRVGQLTDSTLIARRIGTARLVVVATAEYLNAHGRPSAPHDLAKHQCLSNLRAWRFDGERGKVEVPVEGQLQTNSPEGVRAAVLSNVGVTLAPIWLYGEDIEAGRVVTLLDDWTPAPLPIHAVYPTRQFLPLKVSAFVDFLAAEFSISPWVSAYGTPDA